MADLINVLGLVICNKGNSSTFHKRSILDLTLATPNLARKVSGWRVLDEESLSDHFYIVFDVHLGAAKNDAQNSRFPKIDFKILESALTTESFNQVTSCNEAEESALALTETIHACCTVTPAGKRGRKPATGGPLKSASFEKQPTICAGFSKERGNGPDPEIAQLKKRTRRQRGGA